MRLNQFINTFTFLIVCSITFAQPVWHSADQRTASGTSNTVSINKPTNVVAGDLILVFMSAQISNNSNGSNFSTPSGYTLIRSEHDISNKKRPEVAVFYRIATGSEGNISVNVNTQSGNTPRWKAYAVRVSNVDPSNPIGNRNGTNTGNSNSTSQTISSINTTNPNSMLVAASTVSRNISSNSVPSGMTSRYFINGSGDNDDQDENAVSLHIGTQVYPTVTNTGSKTFSWSGSGIAAAAMFTVRAVTCSPAMGSPTFALGATSNRCKGSGSVTYSATATGATGYTYSLDAASLAAGNSIVSGTGQVTFTAAWTGTSTITVSAAGCQGPKTATHTARTLNDLATPVFSLGASSGKCIGEEKRVYDATATNATGMTYSLDTASLTNGLTLFSDIGSVTFPETFSGIAIVTATASGCGGPISSEHTITVSTQGATDDSDFLRENDSTTTNVYSNDICDIDSSTISILVPPTKGVASIPAHGYIKYKPNADYFGTDSLTYRICGRNAPGVCSTAKVRYRITEFFTDTYFNRPASNCQEPYNSEQGLQMVFQYATADSMSLYSNPQVADLDGDGTIEMVAISSTGLSTSNPRSAKNLKVIDGATGQTIRNIVTPYISYDGPTSMAMADLDGDGDVEIIIGSLYARNATADQKYLFCYDHLGNLLWKSNSQYGVNTGGNGSSGNIGLADFNHDGIPEVYTYNGIFNALTGVKLCDGGANGMGIQANYNGVQQSIVVAANVRPSANLELIAGRTVYEVVITNTNGTAGNSMTPINYSTSSTLSGLSAVADMDLDGELDVIVIAQNALLYIWNPRTNSLIASYSTGSTDSRGALFIGDVDGDGVPNIGYCRDNAVDMLKFDPATNALSLKWSLPTTDGSGRTGLTMFDFDHDGIQEIVYRDETTLRILDGTGTSAVTLHSVPAFSTTGMEGPIVADVDNDGAAEIIVTSEGGSSDGDRISSIRVYRSIDFKWAPARKVWNQFAYYNVHIGDDYQVTTNQANHGREFFATNTARCPEGFQSRPLNAFNVQATLISNDGCPIYNLPDAEVLITSSSLDTLTNVATITYIALNRADIVSIPAATNVSFYRGNPYTTAATRLGSEITSAVIPPLGKSNPANIQLANVYSGDQIYAVINDDASTAAPFSLPKTTTRECNYANNAVAFRMQAPTGLGVTLLTFVAYKMEKTVELYWATSSEIDNDYFEVQKSTDGESFRTFDTLEGAGTTTERQTYSTVDEDPSSGITYYRLRQVDFDGNYSFSDIKSVDFDNPKLKLFPNPTVAKINIVNPFKTVAFDISDVKGRKLMVGELEQGVNTFDVTNYPPGIYLVRFTNEITGKVETYKFQKEQ